MQSSKIWSFPSLFAFPRSRPADTLSLLNEVRESKVPIEVMTDHGVDRVWLSRVDELTFLPVVFLRFTHEGELLRGRHYRVFDRFKFSFVLGAFVYEGCARVMGSNSHSIGCVWRRGSRLKEVRVTDETHSKTTSGGEFGNDVEANVCIPNYELIGKRQAKELSKNFVLKCRLPEYASVLTSYLGTEDISEHLKPSQDVLSISESTIQIQLPAAKKSLPLYMGKTFHGAELILCGEGEKTMRAEVNLLLNHVLVKEEARAGEVASGMEKARVATLGFQFVEISESQRSNLNAIVEACS